MGRQSGQQRLCTELCREPLSAHAPVVAHHAVDAVVVLAVEAQGICSPTSDVLALCEERAAVGFDNVPEYAAVSGLYCPHAEDVIHVTSLSVAHAYEAQAVCC